MPKTPGVLRVAVVIAGASLGAALLAAGPFAAARMASAPSTAGAGSHAPAAFRASDRVHPTISVAKSAGFGVKTSQSNNWSGYNQGILDTGKQYSAITGTWTVPTATQHTTGQAEYSASWIGIGGGCLDSSCSATDSTLIQAGTEQDVSSTGEASYSAWYELIPAPSIASTIAVHPGDVIRCSITQSTPGLWTIVLTDTTDGQGFSQTVPYSSTEATAEWIEETPVVVGSSGSAGISALPNLGTVAFSGATANGADPGLVPAQAIQLIDSNNNVLATPSAPAGGNAFNDCTFATSCATP
ncbi:MAG: G1 family glutamic endopeptidase [Acidimicrobiales bacterium]